jgi:16S rRNA C967 or C1407 C5-methylase (RsmB/RsmF family)
MGKPKVDFHHYFGEIYGERWGALAEALRGEALYETLHHPGCRPYHLDRSSAAAARALGVEPGNRVLDLCAAPGGKSLLLATALQGRGAKGSAASSTNLFPNRCAV